MSTKKARKTTKKKAAAKKPLRRGAKKRAEAREEGPRSWWMALRATTYTRLPVDRMTAAGPGAAPPPAINDNIWVSRLSEFKQRKAAAVSRVAASPGATGPGAMLAAAAPTGWRPLGPTVLTRAQAKGRPSVGGRVSGLVVAPGGSLLYAASANGGVFRSDDAGITWTPLSDPFDANPTNFASTSLACGAIAISPTDTKRIYVGTGEGDTHHMFKRRVTFALPAYRGVGPICSKDGGQHWTQEPTAAGSPTLEGKAFFALAVDPANGEHVIAATTDGLYERRLVSGAPEWTQRETGEFSSVIATTVSGASRFYAARWGQRVLSSPDGETWTDAGTGFPATAVGRIALAAHAQNASVVYAFVAREPEQTLHGVYRLDVASGKWKNVSNLPAVLPLDNGGNSQGDYDLAIAVDPQNHDIIYIGGSYYGEGASIWRCEIKASGASFRATATSIGEHAHSDVHVLVHTANEPNQLWAACDGGVFLNRNPRANGTFGARNNGLACLCPNFIGQHPTDPNILFTGLQDNGTARTSGSSSWRWVYWGDGGYCVINWNEPQQVLIFMNGRVSRTTTGGEDETEYKEQAEKWVTMTQPIVGMPYNPASPDEAKIVAAAAGKIVHVSTDFGETWPETFPVGTPVFALAFANAKRLIAGTTEGEIYVAELSGTKWKATPINVAALGPPRTVTDIAVDWADPSRQSFYVAFAGMSGDYRHVWHYDGTRWTARSGTAGSSKELLDVEHNALAVDRLDANHIYVGADIGVWHSIDGGENWEPLSNGLPDAPVFDLQIHPTQRLLRAATHGRGVYELTL